MTIKSSLAAAAVVFSVVLFFAPSAEAKEQPEPRQVKDVPVNITIQTGDTLTSIADAHATTYVRIFNANDFIANPDVINADDEIRIPTAEEELPDRYGELSAQLAAATTTAAATATPVVAGVAETAPVAVAQPAAQPAAAPVQQQTAKPVYAASSAGNTYYSGYCTWYAKERRPDLPNMLGNGGQWVANAAAQGFATGSTPRVGAVAEMPGHVAIVEAVNGDGTIVISEMNGWAGFGVVGSRTDSASTYRYIY